MSKKGLADRRTRKDGFHKRARQRGFRARSVFKLEEIDLKLGLVSRGARVLDLGCYPGSWLQYCIEVAGAGGHFVGLDRKPLDPPLAKTRVVVGDVHEIEISELLGELEAFDLVLSDMAPDTTGIRHLDQARSETLFERALDIAELTLAPGGGFVGKLFQGPDFQSLVKRCRASFETVKIVKPKGSRQQSIEQYVAGRGWRGGPSSPATGE